MAFLVSAFFSGVAGGLLAHLITTISPTLFTFFLTFNLLIMIVVGGLGSTTGAVIGAALFAWGGEALRIVERPMDLGVFHDSRHSRYAHGGLQHHPHDRDHFRPPRHHGTQRVQLELVAARSRSETIHPRRHTKIHEGSRE